MNNVICYIGPGFTEHETQRLMAMLHMRNISHTTDRTHATLIIEPKEPKGIDASLQEKMQSFEPSFQMLHSVDEIINYRLKAKQKKPTFFVPNDTITRYNNTKRYNNQRVFYRTKNK